MPTDLKAQIEAALKVLSELSDAARNSGDGDLWHASNRAWNELYQYQTVTMKDAIVRKAATDHEHERDRNVEGYRR